MTTTKNRDYYRKAFAAYLHANKGTTIKSIAQTAECDISALASLANGTILNVKRSKHAEAMRRALQLCGIEERAGVLHKKWAGKKMKSAEYGAWGSKTKRPGFVKIPPLNEAQKTMARLNESIASAFMQAAHCVLEPSMFLKILEAAWKEGK